MKLLIKFPTRGRPDKFFTTLNLYSENCSDINNTFFLITIDRDDVTMNNPTVLDKLNTLKNVFVFVGDSETKTDAINRDISDFTEEWDMLLLASDDMIPQSKSYDLVIKKLMKEHFPDTDGVLHFNDGYQKENLNTLCILGKKYYERFNYIYYPEYKSCWSDNEFMEVSRLLNKVVYYDLVVIRHEHPDWGFDNHDNIHTLNSLNYNHDLNLYNNRKKINFGL